MPLLHYCQPSSDRQLPRALYALHDDPLAAGRELHLHDARLGYVMGSAVSHSADCQLDDYPWVEVSVIEAGELQLEWTGGALQLKAGDAFVLPRGLQCRWRHQGELRRLFMAFPGRASEGPMPSMPVLLDPDAPREPSPPPAASVLLSPEPTATGCDLFESGGGALRVGMWECTGYARKAVSNPHCELMLLYAGAVTLAVAGEVPCHVRAGEAVLVPAEIPMAWDSRETVRKLYCILR
ncbi:cupin domain-containing protein [Pseudomonas oryzihabitans]|uniref:Cupin superfamily protein n=1 Tax=Pseudomonas oryzihabitans TaxID=47885 RepID=A0AAJ2BMR4_9PSED|nr:cupin domain-containing protein [Pseudomonas psychrotolerans]MDR6236883.1 putative cupin superfamily protein [Pseudomonas psychrotolerans]MDR6353690.1 putative cupin superfamily protein [Pseudomonas psychrotolerans]